MENEHNKEITDSRSAQLGTCINNVKKSTSTDVIEELVAPDGGWGWMIVIANCIIMFLLPTVSICFGVMYVALVDEKGISNAAGAGIIGLLLGISSVLGPFATSMSNYYTHRSLTLAGVSFMFVGLFLCTWCLNIVWLYFCFTLVGVGSALAVPQAFLIGQKYFTSKRVAVNGLASAAFTLGYVATPALLYCLLEGIFSIRETFCVWSAIILNGIVAALLYHPVEWHLKPKPLVTKIPLITFSEHRLPPVMEVEEIAPNSATDNTVISREQTDEPTERNTGSNGISSSNEMVIESEDYKPVHSTVTTTQKVDINSRSIDDEKPPQTLESTEGESFLVRRDHNFRWADCDSRRVSYLSAFSVESFHTTRSYFRSMELLSLAPSEYFDALSGSMLSVNYTENKNFSNGIIQETQMSPSNEAIIEEIPSHTETERSRPKPYVICGLYIPRIMDIIKFNLLSNPVFLIIGFSTAINRQLYYGYLSFIPMIAKHLDLQEKVPFLLFLIAIFEITSKFGIIFISGRRWFQMRHIYMTASVSNCIAIIATPFSVGFSSMAAATSLLGLGLGVTSCIGPVLLVEYLGVDMLPHTYGLVLLLSGVASFIIFPLQGLTIDQTGTTAIVCFIFATLCIIPFILWMLMPVAQKMQRKKGNL